jgi:ribosome-associated protein
MIQITPQLALDETELNFRFVRAPGPGGQNVNKVSSAVELRFDVARSSALPDALKQRLVKLAGKRLTADGLLLIDAHRFRTQSMNRKDAIERLVALLQAAAIAPKTRTPTRPSRAAREARLTTKRKASQIKQTRRGNISLGD